MAEVSFGEWLKRRRKAEGWTQEQLALQIHCSTSALRKMESELRRPSREIIERLAEVFNIPSEEHKSFQRFARGDWAAFEGGDAEEAPWRVTRPRTNLPASTTSFIGREKEQKEIIDLIAKSRLVTLTGAGGIGKTRLSLEAAQQVLTSFPNGLWFIELAPLSDPALVPQTITSTLGLIEQAGRSPLDVLIDFLQKKQALLILDNCEHLIQACAQLAEALLRACPDLHILATSREDLSIPGETLYLVSGLTIPDLAYTTIETLPTYEAVHLFVERARTAFPTFSIRRDNAHAVAQICYHLDGIPLALELAAARVKLMRVEEIAARLYDRFRLLIGGARTALPRHQTLRAMIDWSHDLLSEPERVLFRRLSVFAGGCSLEAAEGVCIDVGQDVVLPEASKDGILSHDILDLLTSLVNKSLVVTQREQGQDTRYRMLETIRQYAHDKLWEAGEGEMMRQRHLAYFIELAEQAEFNLRAFDMITWLDRLEAELDNNRIALDWAQESDVQAQLRLASALLWFWHIRGHKREGIDWLEKGLSIEAIERGGKPLWLERAIIRGRALNASGFLISMGFEQEKAEKHWKESLALFQELGPAGKQGMAHALLSLGGLIFTGSQARNLIKQSLILFREIENKFGAAECLMYLVGNARADNDYDQAIILAKEELALRREIGDLDGIATALGQLAELTLEQDNFQEASKLHEESLAIFRKVRNKWAIGFGLSMFAEILLRKGNYEQAAQKYEEALTFAREISDSFLMAFSFYGLGTIFGLWGNYARATQMITDSLTVFGNVNHHWMIAGSLHALGDIALAEGNEEKASQEYEAELIIGREAQVEIGIIFALGGLGKAAWAKGEYELAKEQFQEMLRMSQAIDSQLAMFHALCGLGRVAQSQGDYATARAFCAEALEAQRQWNDRPFEWLSIEATMSIAIYYPLGALAALAAANHKMGRGARLLGTSEFLYNRIQFQLSPAERAEHDQAIATARAALGEEAFKAAWEEGQQMTLEQAVEYALQED